MIGGLVVVTLLSAKRRYVRTEAKMIECLSCVAKGVELSPSVPQLPVGVGSTPSRIGVSLIHLVWSKGAHSLIGEISRLISGASSSTNHSSSAMRLLRAGFLT